MRTTNVPRWLQCASAAAITVVIGASLVPMAAAAAPTEAEFAALQAEVRTLQDRDAIRQLLLEYGHMLDTHDLAGYANLFSPDGEWIGGFGRARGPRAILALMRKYMGTQAPDPHKVMGFHLMTTIIIHVHGDHATALSKLVFMYRGKDDRPVPVMGGHYEDTLVRLHGHWCFQRRVVMMDIPYQDPRTIKGTPPPPPFLGH
ncbi:MAG: nuclear transport factor 2 family protein [Steroidobacteraceae bacterium]